eukprot:CAMPEP_0172506198 /NCGR_PEP_ID=MMETSP1066-20121228/192658_1 /TAXON_ID=671091 /ORGANISM="Coscinodiscus wailesii, Strain CCMP2513" /LENGTH=49 /DNA_ID=CAMNT_0013283113 /DNA_START=61 /DNA_END=210 /DNA_ORIENTATION=-
MTSSNHAQAEKRTRRDDGAGGHTNRTFVNEPFKSYPYYACRPTWNELKR